MNYYRLPVFTYRKNLNVKNDEVECERKRHRANQPQVRPGWHADEGLIFRQAVTNVQSNGQIDSRGKIPIIVDKRKRQKTCSWRSTSRWLREPREPWSWDEDRWRLCTRHPWILHHRRCKPSDESVIGAKLSKQGLLNFSQQIYYSLEAKKKVMYQLVVVQLGSVRAVQEPPCGGSNGGSTDVSTNSQVTEEEPSRNERFVCLTGRLQEEHYIYYIEYLKTCNNFSSLYS